MKFKDYRKLPIRKIKGEESFAIFTKNGKKYFSSSKAPTEKEVQRIAQEWTAQSAQCVMDDCRDKWMELTGKSFNDWGHVLA